MTRFILHVRVGADNWKPTKKELRKVGNLFQEAADYLDAEVAVVATDFRVSVDLIPVAEDDDCCDHGYHDGDEEAEHECDGSCRGEHGDEPNVSVTHVVVKSQEEAEAAMASAVVEDIKNVINSSSVKTKAKKAEKSAESKEPVAESCSGACGKDTNS